MTETTPIYGEFCAFCGLEGLFRAFIRCFLSCFPVFSRAGQKKVFFLARSSWAGKLAANLKASILVGV
jgi:hypothetical protein